MRQSLPVTCTALYEKEPEPKQRHRLVIYSVKQGLF